MSVNDPTQLVVAHRIGVDPGTPGLGTVTSLAAGAGITLTPNPVTASGTVAGKLYTISTQGDVPAPGTNDGSKILFDNGWTVAAIPPIPVPPVDGGTGADLSGLADNATIFFDGTKFAESAALLDAAGNISTPATGVPAHVAIGSGVSVDATINLTAILPGVVGNAYTVILEAGVGLGVALSALEVGTEITVTLGTDGAGDPDPTKNTATLVKGVLDGESTLFTSALAGDGSGVLVPESQLFFGGAEAITATGGGASIAGPVYAQELTINFGAGDTTRIYMPSPSVMEFLDVVSGPGNLTFRFDAAQGILAYIKETVSVIQDVPLTLKGSGISGVFVGTGDDSIQWGLEAVTGNWIQLSGSGVDLGSASNPVKGGHFSGTVDAGGYTVADMQAAPASAGAAGVKGDIRWTNGFVYLCSATNTWLRAALTTWT